MSVDGRTPRSRGGVIGGRQLIAVQTFDIARLTSHPVVLVPSSFIAVTGRGPKDSNESGKTSFLAAVALLLGDPEWRMSGAGPKQAPGLLFEPVTAGATPDDHGPATVGYVVGVFADSVSAQDTAHTVWLQISTKPEHIEVRHKAGTHLLLDGDDRSRHEEAPAHFRRLGGSPLGPTEYAEVLYGRAPRLLAYVATRGRMRSRPSLLKLDAGTFSPAQIGDALLSLTGRAELLANDSKARSELAQKKSDFRDFIEASEKADKAERQILRGVDLRDRARETIRLAIATRRAACACLLIEALVRVARVSRARDRNEERLQGLAGERQAAQVRLDTVKDANALRIAVQAADLSKRKAAENVSKADRAIGGLMHEISGLEAELKRATEEAQGYDGPSAAEVRIALDRKLKHVEIAKEQLVLLKQSADSFSAQLAEAMEGRIGLAGNAISRLAAVGIPADGLMSSTYIDPRLRGSWEARLTPWREAVCVRAENLDAALNALTEMPGAIVIAPPNPSEEANRWLATAADLPDGVLDAPETAVFFLRQIAAATTFTVSPPRSVTTELGVHVLGGFETPITGQRDICEFLEQQLHDAEATRDRHEDALKLFQRRVAELTKDIARAEAKKKLYGLVEQMAIKESELAEQRLAIPALREASAAAAELSSDAARTLRTAQESIERIQKDIRRILSELSKAEREKETLDKLAADDHLAQAHAGWGGTVETALEELNWLALPEDDDDASPGDEVPVRAAIAREQSRETQRRKSQDLFSSAGTQLASALGALGADPDASGAGAPELTDALRYNDAGIPDPHGRVLKESLDAVSTWLDGAEERDRGAREQIEFSHSRREKEREFLEGVVNQSYAALHETQESIRQRVCGAFDAVALKLNDLNRKDRGYGADLRYEIVPPQDTEQLWTCLVTPRWRRNPGAPLLSYDAPTNTAQEKIFSIHLVLAALLAAPDPQGRVLILDELGDSLGDEHRREAVMALRDAAKEHGLTVLATCQDSVMREVGPVFGEILYFHYPSKSETLNRPTKMFGHDEKGHRVEFVADQIAGVLREDIITSVDDWSNMAGN